MNTSWPLYLCVWFLCGISVAIIQLNVLKQENSHDTYLVTAIFDWAKGIIAAIRETTLENNPMNYRMVWVGWDLKDHTVLTPLPWIGAPSTGWHCSKPYPLGKHQLPGMRQKAKELQQTSGQIMEELQKPTVFLNLLQYGACWLSFHFSLTSHFGFNAKLLFSSSKFWCRFG